MQTNQDRIKYLDIAKGIGIILVIMGHSGFLSDTLNFFINSFHMPLFFMVAGMLTFRRGFGGETASSFLLKKLRTLAVPYIWFSLLSFVFCFVEALVLGTFQTEFVGSIPLKIAAILTLDGNSVLWFLPALQFSLVITFILIDRLGQLRGAIIGSILGILAFLCSIFLPNPEDMTLPLACLLMLVRVILRSLISAIFVLIGYIGAGLFEEPVLKLKRPIQLLLGIVLLTGCFVLSRFVPHNDFHRLYLGNGYMYCVCALSGSLGVILLSMGISAFRPLEFFGRNSLIVMCTHLDFNILYLSIKLAFLINIYVTRAKSYVFMLVIVAATLSIETIIIMVINRFCPFLLGRRKK